MLGFSCALDCKSASNKHKSKWFNLPKQGDEEVDDQLVVEEEGEASTCVVN